MVVTLWREDWWVDLSNGLRDSCSLSFTISFIISSSAKT